MGKVTANHNFLRHGIDDLEEQYIQNLEEYDLLFNQWLNHQKKIRNKNAEVVDHEDMDVIQKLFSCQQKISSIKYILILSLSAYLEGIVNFYLCHKLNVEEFTAIDGCSHLDKWVYIIKMVLPNYEIKKNYEEHCLLKTLIASRNDIMHMKPKIEKDKVEHKGSPMKHLDEEHKEDRKIVKKWLELPDILLSKLNGLDHSAGRFTAFFSSVSDIKRQEFIIKKSP